MVKTASLPAPEGGQFRRSRADHEQRDYSNGVLDLRFYAARAIPPYVGILLFLILPGIFVLGLLLIPLGILLHRRKLQAAGELPSEYPALELKLPIVRNGLLFVAVTSGLNVLIFTYASYKGVSCMDTTYVLPHGDGTGIQRVPEFAARASGMCAVPHWSRRRLVCAFEVVGLAAGVCGERLVGVIHQFNSLFLE